MGLLQGGSARSCRYLQITQTFFTKIHIWSVHGGPNQQWVLNPILYDELISPEITLTHNIIYHTWLMFRDANNVSHQPPGYSSDASKTHEVQSAGGLNRFSVSGGTYCIRKLQVGESTEISFGRQELADEGALHTEDAKPMEWDVRVAKGGHKYVFFFRSSIPKLMAFVDFMLVLKAA